jgi:hypothetical protein
VWIADAPFFWSVRTFLSALLIRYSAMVLAEGIRIYFPN